MSKFPSLSHLILLLVFAAGCNFSPSTSDAINLEQTQIALAVQQTSLAKYVQGQAAITAQAQQSMLTEQAATQLAQQTALATAAVQPVAPDLDATQAALSIEQTVMALQVQQTAAMATQVAMAAGQTAAASGASGAGPQAAAPITPQAGPGRPPPESQLFDDFSDLTRWPTANQATYSTGYQGGLYLITVNAARSDAWAVAGYKFTGNVVVETSAQFLQSSMSSHYGVICRFQDANNFYYFSVQEGGNYFAAKYKNGVTKLLGSGKPEYSPAINQGGGNRIQLRCAGNELYLSINDVQLGVAVDYDFTSGDVGLIAGAGDQGYMSAGFDYILAEE